MKSTGTQHIVEFLNCSCKYLNDTEKLEEFLKEALQKADLHFVKVISHKFQPIGVTVLAIISESHIGLHTYPEISQVSVDVYTCTSGEKHEVFINFLKEKLQADFIRKAAILRGNPIDFQSNNWIVANTEYGFDLRYYADKRIFFANSKFQKIDIIENRNFGELMFLDNRLTFAENNAKLITEQLLSPLKIEKVNDSNFLVIGASNPLLISELANSYSFCKIDVVEEDKLVVKAIENLSCYDSFAKLPDYQGVMNIQNPLLFFEFEKEYHAIIYLLSTYSESFTHLSREEYFSLMVKKIFLRLKEQGVFSFHIGAEYDEKNTKMVTECVKKYFSKLSISKIFVPAYGGIQLFGAAIKENS